MLNQLLIEEQEHLKQEKQELLAQKGFDRAHFYQLEIMIVRDKQSTETRRKASWLSTATPAPTCK